MESRANRGLGLVLALAVGGSSLGYSVPVGATARVVSPASEQEDLAKAKKLYKLGKAKYDTFDYEGAVEVWTEAYSIVPESAATTRNLLAYNIATAQEKAYGVDNDVEHLKTAALLLEGYIANYKAINEANPQTRSEVATAEARIASLKEQIAAHEGAAAPPPVAAAPAEPAPEAPPPEVEETPVDSPEVAAEKRKANAMVKGGYGAMGAGFAFLLASGISFAVARVSKTTNDTTEVIDPTDPPEDPTERRARIAGWVLLGLGAASLVGSGVLLGLGYSKRSKIRKGQVAFAPYGSPDGGGAVVQVRF